MRINTAKPTQTQQKLFLQYLKQCVHVEHAALLAGVPRKVLYRWLELGRAGEDGFREFVEAIDQQTAEIAKSLMDPLLEAARAGDLKVAQWIYNTRVKPFEDAAHKRMLALEEESTPTGSQEQFSGEDLAAAEARLEAQEVTH